MESKSSHHRQFIPETKNGKKINYESTYSFSRNEQKEKKEENPRSKVIKKIMEPKEVRKKKEIKVKETRKIKEVQKVEMKNIKNKKETNIKKKKEKYSNQNKIEEVSNTMIINMIAHNRLTKNT